MNFNWGLALAILIIVEELVAAVCYTLAGQYWKAANFFFGACILWTVIKMN
jgi:hypothetical protein